MKMSVEQALGATEVYCERRVPADLRDSLRIECSRRGNAITIVERRPPWRPGDAELEWTATKIAQLRFDPATELWSLRCPDSNGRWHPYPEAHPSVEVATLLNEVERDRTGIFWG